MTGLPEAERDRRWTAIREAMRKCGVEVLVAPDGGEVNRGWARYLAGIVPPISAAVLLFADGDCELLTAIPLGCRLATRQSWAEICRLAPDPLAAAAAGIERRLGPSAAIGCVDLERAPARWKDLLGQLANGDGPLDMHSALEPIARVKSAFEITLYERSARIADEAVGIAPRAVVVGRPEYAVAADVDHAVYAAGAGSTMGGVLVFPLRPEYESVNFFASDRPLEPGDCAIIEVTPSWRGMETQLATMVALGEPPPVYRRMYETSVSARAEALALLRPGRDLAEIVESMRSHVEASGFRFNDRAAGHLVEVVGLEPRITGGFSAPLEAGMVVVLHAVVVNDDEEEVLRGDTYVVTADGHRRLNALDEGLWAVEAAGRT